MPEILTESFCERCGTRYTFQSTAPKVGRLAKMKVMTRGLKNYVLSDDTSLDEAFADARTVDDRQQSVEQLDAFHKTFNFCMSCRQYTCANCWNDREGKCLSCAPFLGQVVAPAPAPFPNLNPISGIVEAAAGGNGHAVAPTNGHAAAEADASAWPQTDLSGVAEPGSPLAAPAPLDPTVSRLEALFGLKAAQAAPAEMRVPEPEAVVETPEAQAVAQAPEAAEAPSEAVDVAAFDETGEATEIAAAQAEVAEALSQDSFAAEDKPAVVEAVESVAEGVEAVEPAIEATEAASPGPRDPAIDEIAAAAAAQTHGFLDRHRARPVPPRGPATEVPLQPAPLGAPRPTSIPVPFTPLAPALPADPAHEPIAAVGPSPAPRAPISMPSASVPLTPISLPAAVVPRAPISTPSAHVPNTPISTPLPVVPFTPTTTPLPVVPPVAPAMALPQAVPPAQTPSPSASWQMVAPESPVAPPTSNGHAQVGSPPALDPQPQWPTVPAWPAPLPRAGKAPSADVVWVESTRDLLNRPGTTVQACLNCGLALSATARFCRRCGANQISA